MITLNTGTVHMISLCYTAEVEMRHPILRSLGCVLLDACATCRLWNAGLVFFWPEIGVCSKVVALL